MGKTSLANVQLQVSDKIPCLWFHMTMSTAQQCNWEYPMIIFIFGNSTVFQLQGYLSNDQIT